MSAAARRAWCTLAGWALVIAALAILGAHVAQRLVPMSLSMPGTPSARAEQILDQRFGNAIPLAVLLRGPAADIRREGPGLARAFRAVGGVQVLSPWDGPHGLRATLRALQPRGDGALMLVSYMRPQAQAMSAVVPGAERLLARAIRAPVRANLSGLAVVGRALQRETLADTRSAELIALPLLLVVLLLVFGSPLAAAVPLLVGGATVLAGRGLLYVATFVTPINALGVSIAAMMGLALGVDYALLMVSRVRQERAAGAGAEQALRIARRAAGRTIVFAGGTLALAMAAACLVAAGGLLSSVALGVVLSGLLSVALAVSAMPALLRLLMPHLDRWRVPAPWAAPRTGAARVRRLSRPAIAIPLIMVGLFALASPAGALRMGPPDVTQLPSSDPARRSFEAVREAIGPGWSAPFVVVASARHGVIATSGRLAAIARWQASVARQADVSAVIGPGSLPGEQQQIAKAHRELASIPARLGSARRGLAALGAGLGQLGRAIGALRTGVHAAAAGAGRMGSQARRAREGAARLAAGLTGAAAGARRLRTGLGSAQGAAGALGGGLDGAAGGMRRLTAGLAGAHSAAGRLASRLDDATSASGRLAAGLDSAGEGAGRLLAADRSLGTGAGQLAQGLDTLDATAHAALAPVDALAAQLAALKRWVETVPLPTGLATQRLAAAIATLEQMTAARNDPLYTRLRQQLMQARGDMGLIPPAPFFREQVLAGLNSLIALAGSLHALVDGLDRATAGAHALAAGALAAEGAAGSLAAALHSLAAGGRTLQAGLARIGAGEHSLSAGLGRLYGAGGRLSAGLARLQQGERALNAGLARLGAGGASLGAALAPLGAGAAQLDAGLRALAGGDGELARALAGGERDAGRLQGGLAAAGRPLRGYAALLGGYQKDERLLSAQSPYALDSGYLLLSVLDGTGSPLREEIAQAINVGGGGQAARILIVASSAPNAPATAALSRRLQGKLPALAGATGATVAIGQGDQYLIDYTNATTARFPWLILALALVAALALTAVLRALPLALISVALNLATIAVAFGALQLLTALHAFGASSYIDAVSAAGILAIMFVLSIDYEVFLLTRMREALQSGASAQAAISHGLRNTAGVITGAAAIMTGVFLAFATAQVVSLRQFGAGLALAVLLDATIVRLVLLPAIMRAIGARVWWLPATLERRIARVEGALARR